MTVITRAGAASHVGKIRSNNQDSGFIGEHVFAVADGMGGHAGGDVASALAARYFRECDDLYPTTEEAETGLREMLEDANGLIVETVAEHPELRGMGTTASAIAFVPGELDPETGDSIVVGHIGDSRIYRLHEGEMEQMTTDHTFVQKLVDAGRITPEEALVHPRRSVLMKVLGDVETSPDADTATYPAVSGDRWLLCSDGLSSYVEDEDILDIFRHDELDPGTVCEMLVQRTLDNGAPDNVTVLILEVGDTREEALQPTLVGSAANELKYGKTQRRQRAQRFPLTQLFDPLRKDPPPMPEHEEYVPMTDEFLEQLIREDDIRKRRRLAAWLVTALLIVTAAIGVSAGVYSWTQAQHYVGVAEGKVTIFQGVQRDLGPIPLSHPVEQTDIEVDDLSDYQREQVENTINAGSLDEARQVVERLREEL